MPTVPFTADLSNALELISNVIERTKGDADRFAETLRRKRIPHLSFSQITAVEFCETRYHLQYIELLEPDPTPEYFTKGKVIHQLIARNYIKAARNQKLNPRSDSQALQRQYHGGDLHHLVNAMTVHRENFWHGCEVIAVEKPFVMTVHKALPPCVGVIDLILKKGDHFIAVDHKTGRDFYPQDELQMAIYVEYIKREYGAKQCRFYYDQYRWVNNLDRIRKPAFIRTPVTLPAGAWRSALRRMQDGYQKIERLQSAKAIHKNGECFRCPYRKNCW